jgi:hypothetical protein
MKTVLLDLQSKNQIVDYFDKNHLVHYESEILKEVLAAIEQNNTNQLEWFNQFGDSLRVVTINVYACRKQLEFGFSEIAFDQYGWFRRPEFLDKEDQVFGNPYYYSEHSTLTLGHGINDIWTYALDYNFGTAGGGYGLSVYGKQFKSREDAMTCGLNDLKSTMTAKIGNTDTSNYKQCIIMATLKDITKAPINMVQLSLF